MINRIIKKIKSIKFQMKLPKSSTIIVFNHFSSSYIIEYILSDRKDYIIYRTRPEIIFIHPIVILKLVTNMLQFSWTKPSISLMTKIVDYYRFVIFSIIKPKVVITMIDNSASFGRLSICYNQAAFIAIQNGRRVSTKIHSPNKKIIHDHYCCFGQNDIDLFEKWGFKAKQYHPIGSLKSGIAATIHNELNKRNKYDICLVSIWRPYIHKNHPSYIPSLNDIWNSFDISNRFTHRYITEHNMKLCIVLAHYGSYEADNDSIVSDNEEEYWIKLFGDNVTLIQNDKKKLPSYKAIMESDIVIGVASTLILEAFGMGKKILYCDFSGENKFHDYNTNILFRENDYKKFATRLNELISTPYNQYVEQNKKYKSYLMNNDINYPPHLYIRNLIDNFLD